MIKTTNMQVGLVQWQQGDGIGSQISSTLESLGHEAVKVSIDEKLPDSLDVVLAYGPFGSLVPVANQLQAYPPSQRPLFVLWMTEQFPNPELPEWVRSLGGNFRTQAERLAFRQSRPGEWEVNPRLRLLTTKAHRFRYYGDIFWLQRKGILSLLVIGSQWTVDFLLERGFDAMVGYYGYHPDL
ncbi:MAG: hypothetical protein KDI62_08930, partial [Anaerolineae bacterium]|nr:hypothetical protein [Anaerolineae bacterium]